MTTYAESKVRVANIKVTSNDIIKNWWKLNYFDAGQEVVTNYGPNMIPNAGGEGTTDWVDSNGDGLGDQWGGSEIPSIVTGNGFIGRAQKMLASAGGAICNLGMNGTWLVNPSSGHHRYRMTFSYRCFDNRNNPAVRGMNVRWFTTGWVQAMSTSYAPNTGSAIHVVLEFEVTDLRMVGFGCASEDVSIGASQYWYEVGEINLYEYF